MSYFQKKEVWITLIIASVLCSGGWVLWSQQRESVQAKAREQLYEAGEDAAKLQDLASQSGKTRAGVDAGWRVALKYFESGEFQKALAIYQSLSKSPYLTDLERGVVVLSMGKAYRELKQEEEAVARFKQASQSGIDAIKKEAEKLLTRSQSGHAKNEKS